MADAGTLSEEDDDFTDEIAAAQQRRNAPNVSKKAAARVARAGTGRTVAFSIPTPLNYKVVGTGYQQYRLPDDKRVYQRREFKYEDEFKIGSLVTKKPGPPTLFSSTFLFTKAKKLLVADADDEPMEEGRDRLVRRIETRIVRISNAWFLDMDLSEPPLAAAMTAANANIALVFGDAANEWTQKQLMAWAWPEIALVGDAKEHYQSGAISQQQRDTSRLVGICLLSEPNGSASYKSIFGVDNRFELLDGELRKVADTLSTLAREGLLSDTTGTTIVRTDLDLNLLFGEIQATHGKKSPAMSEEEYNVGDPVTITLFSHGIEEDEDDEHLEWVEVEGAADGGYIEMTPEERFLYHLGEAALNKVITSIEQAVPAKMKTYAGSTRARGSGPGGVSKLSKAGRRAVVMLKKALPKVSLALAIALALALALTLHSVSPAPTLALSLRFASQSLSSWWQPLHRPRLLRATRTLSFARSSASSYPTTQSTKTSPQTSWSWTPRQPEMAMRGCWLALYVHRACKGKQVGPSWLGHHGWATASMSTYSCNMIVLLRAHILTAAT